MDYSVAPLRLAVALSTGSASGGGGDGGQRVVAVGAPEALENRLPHAIHLATADRWPEHADDFAGTYAVGAGAKVTTVCVCISSRCESGYHF